MAPLGVNGGPQEMTKVSSLPMESAVKFVTALDTGNRVSECAHAITNDTNELTLIIGCETQHFCITCSKLIP